MSLRTKTSLLLAFLIIVISSFVAFRFLRFLEDSLRKSVFDGLKSVSSVSSESVSRILDDTLNDAEAIASSLSKEALEKKNTSVIEGQLKKIAEIYPKFENGMFIHDMKGNLWADYPPHPETRGENFAFLEYFKITMEKQQGIIGVPYRSARNAEPVLTFTALLRGSSNQILGLLRCSAQLLHPDVLGGIRKTKIGQTGYIYIFDKTRLMILHPEDKRILQRDIPSGANKLLDAAIEGFEGVGETVNTRGVPMLLSLKSIRGTDWILGAQEPRIEAFAPIKKARTRMMWGTMAALLIAVGIGALAVRRLTEPLVKLRKVAMGMGQEREIKGDEFRKQKKDLQEELKTMQSSDEIGNLAKAFSQMYDRLDQAFMSLQGSLRDWERTFDSVADPIFILDRNNRILRLNHAAAHLLKKKPQEVLGETCYRLIHGTEAPPDFCPHEITLKTGKPAKAEVEEPYLGGIFEIATTPIVDEAGQVIGSVHVTRDITERKRAEIKLQESEERYRILAETAHDMIFIIDRKGYVQYVNHFAASQFRTLPEQIIGKLQEELFPHEIAKRQKANLQKVFETGKPFYGENKIQFPNGEVWLGTWLTPIAKESEDVGAVLGISRDITERKRMEEALQLSEEKYRSVVANANDAIFIAQDGMIKFPNPSALDITGISAEEYATTPFINLIHPEDREMVIERHKQRLNGEEVQNNYSFRILNKAGEELWVQLNAVLIKWEERPAVLCFMRDITPQRRLEAQFQQAQKMEAVGTLAGGIAHDFNNLLQTVLGYAEILLHEEVGKSISQELQQIKRAAQRGAELTQQILTFGRKVQSKLRPVDLNIEVRQVQKLLQRTIPKMIHVELRLTDDLGVINADPAQMEQILMNLSVNAKDAMPEGGKLIIGTKNIFLDESYCSGNLEAHPGEHVLLTVSDTGHGMKKETLEHIFEPFYTTKGVGKGTGLGLAMVYGIVKSHGGHIQCFSQPGKGTTFSVYFPVIEDRITIEGPVEEKILVGGKETILLVDDEKPIQELGERILLRSGYTVLKASDGESALEIYRRGDERIDLVILDLIMPGMGGKKCLEKILEINPKAKVVIASGYSPDVTSDNPIETGAKAFVPKPFNINQMLQVVRKVLDE